MVYTITQLNVYKRKHEGKFCNIHELDEKNYIYMYIIKEQLISFFL